MDKKDKERYERITGALRGVGVRDFLIIGLRKTPECESDQLEGFSVFTTNMEMAAFVATLHSILKDDQNIIGFLKKIIEPKIHDQRMVLDLIHYQGGTA